MDGERNPDSAGAAYPTDNSLSLVSRRFPKRILFMGQTQDILCQCFYFSRINSSEIIRFKCEARNNSLKLSLAKESRNTKLALSHIPHPRGSLVQGLEHCYTTLCISCSSVTFHHIRRVSTVGLAAAIDSSEPTCGSGSCRYLRPFRRIGSSASDRFQNYESKPCSLTRMGKRQY
jgi:hypothetical protein